MDAGCFKEMREQIEVSLGNAAAASFLDKSMVSLLLSQSKEVTHLGLTSMHQGSRKMTINGGVNPSL